MKEYREILKSISNGEFPEETEKENFEKFHLLVELYEAGYINGIYNQYYGGAHFINPRMTTNGREYLDELKKKN